MRPFRPLAARPASDPETTPSFRHACRPLLRALAKAEKWSVFNRTRPVILKCASAGSRHAPPRPPRALSSIQPARLGATGYCAGLLAASHTISLNMPYFTTATGAHYPRVLRPVGDRVTSFGR